MLIGSLLPLMAALPAFAAEPAPVVQGFGAAIPFAPQIAVIEGERQLAYELHLTNWARQPLRLRAAEVQDASGGARLARFDEAGLRAVADSPGGGASPDELSIGPGAISVLYFNIPIGRARPGAIRHRLIYEGASGPVDLPLPATTVLRRELPVLGAPLRGGPWAAIYGPELSTGHRRYVYALGGTARIPGRFAIDYFPVDVTGARRAGVHDVLAVADARVAAVRDDVPDPDPAAKAGRVKLADATGNYVALDLGDGRIVFYEHLRRGVTVRPGQRVRRGQVIGAVGMTGQASEPHLHIHMANALSAVGAEGLPYRLEGFTVIGRYRSIEAFGKKEGWAPAAQARPDGMPRPQTVVRFPG